MIQFEHLRLVVPLLFLLHLFKRRGYLLGLRLGLEGRAGQNGVAAAILHLSFILFLLLLVIIEILCPFKHLIIFLFLRNDVAGRVVQNCHGVTVSREVVDTLVERCVLFCQRRLAHGKIVLMILAIDNAVIESPGSFWLEQSLNSSVVEQAVQKNLTGVHGVVLLSHRVILIIIVLFIAI